MRPASWPLPVSLSSVVPLHMPYISTISVGMTLNSGSTFVGASLTVVSTLSLTHSLGKDKKRVSKTIAQSKESLKSAKIDGQPSTIEEALEMVRKEEPPASPEAKENFFMSQIAMGEQLGARGESGPKELLNLGESCFSGPEYYLAAATCFYRSMKVYPSPMELIVIYEQTIPPPIFTVSTHLTE